MKQLRNLLKPLAHVILRAFWKWNKAHRSAVKRPIIQDWNFANLSRPKERYCQIFEVRDL